MKEGESRRNAAFRAVVVGGVLIIAAVVALYSPWPRLFDLREIAVTGNHHVTSGEVVQASGLHRGISLFAVSLTRVEKNIATLPWVKQAVVSRALFHRINVEIVERKPIATTALSSGRCGLVGEGGVIVSTSCEEMASLPVLVGASFSGSAAGARTLDARVVELLEAFGDAACGLLIRAFDVSDPTSVVLEADEGVRVLLGVIDDAGSRAVELAALCRTIEATNYELIDLRFEGEATLVPR